MKQRLRSCVRAGQRLAVLMLATSCTVATLDASPCDCCETCPSCACSGYGGGSCQPQSTSKWVELEAWDTTCESTCLAGCVAINAAGTVCGGGANCGCDAACGSSLGCDSTCGGCSSCGVQSKLAALFLRDDAPRVRKKLLRRKQSDVVGATTYTATPVSNCSCLACSCDDCASNSPAADGFGNRSVSQPQPVQVRSHGNLPSSPVFARMAATGSYGPTPMHVTAEAQSGRAATIDPPVAAPRIMPIQVPTQHNPLPPVVAGTLAQLRATATDQEGFVDSTYESDAALNVDYALPVYRTTRQTTATLWVE